MRRLNLKRVKIICGNKRLVRQIDGQQKQTQSIPAAESVAISNIDIYIPSNSTYNLLNYNS